jgi:zinc-ribbon domain
MALIPCPECGHQVSDRASACPGCGHPVTPVPADLPSTGSAPAPAVEPAAEEAPANRCVCGTWNRGDATRCVSCSRALGQNQAARRPRPVQYVHTGPVYHPITRPDPVRERMDREEESARVLGTVSVVCGGISFFFFPFILGFTAIACGIPAYIKGAKSGLAGIILGILGIILAIWVAATYY